MRFALIDHFDSFTHNIVAWLSKDKTIEVIIIPYGTPFNPANYDALILSPGPKSPKDYPLSLNLLKNDFQIPILGICLGMQMMLESEGATIVPYTPPLHGKSSCLQILQAGPLFQKINKCEVARYHSLIAKDIPETFIILANSPEGHPMAVLHKEKMLLGVQFHPESFLTSSSDCMRDNFLSWIKSCQNQL